MTLPRETTDDKLNELLGGEPAGEARARDMAEGMGRIERHASHQSSAVVVLTVIAVLAACYFAKLVLITIFVSVLIAFMLEPAVGLLERFRMPRALAAAVVLLFIAGLLYVGGYFVYAKSMAFIDALPQYTERVREIATRYKHKATKLQKSTQAMVPETPEEQKTVKVEQQTNWADYITRSLGPVTEVILAVSFIPFLIYFMLTWQEHVRAATVMLFRMENRNAAYVTIGRIGKMIKSFMIGNLFIGGFMAVISWGVFAALGLPNSLVLGVLSGYLSLVPYLGVVFAMIPPLLAALGQASGTAMVIIILTVFGLHLFAINVLYPKFLGSRLQLNPLAVTIALLLWGWLWGAWGLILAVPITAAMKIIFDNIESLHPYGAWMGE